MADAAAVQAIEVLENRAAEIRREAELEATQLEQMASGMRQKLGLPRSTPGVTKTSNTKIKPDQFVGMTRSRAIEVYMRARANNEPMMLSELVVDLHAGGCFLGAEENRWERNVWSVLRQNKLYHVSEWKDKVGEALVQLAPKAWDKPQTRPRGRVEHKPAPMARARKAG